MGLHISSATQVVHSLQWLHKSNNKTCEIPLSQSKAFIRSEVVKGPSFQLNYFLELKSLLKGVITTSKRLSRERPSHRPSELKIRTEKLEVEKFVSHTEQDITFCYPLDSESPFLGPYSTTVSVSILGD